MLLCPAPELAVSSGAAELLGWEAFEVHKAFLPAVVAFDKALGALCLAV